ncbi:hypothetical protein EGW08_020052 [Elysia chlorotica]|uniref:Stanniocalcin n=1 Tax=Elysia chlorotica TaxID=188477 RepID=A0A433SSB6_ELYCH|nr:hypothetical protein EGW08_020052 [Elysia chlorotica]
MELSATVLATACLLVLSLSISDAWLFWRSYPSAKADGKAVDPNCVALAKAGSCEFYPCFEDRLRCGRKWYNVRYGEPYCRDFTAFRERFSLLGQKFINASEPCIANELLSWYKRDRINCHDYTHFAFKALSRCYMRSGFCEAIRSDLINFMTIYRPKHLFSLGALKIWREILRIVNFCDPKAVKYVINAFWESIKE